MKSSFQTLCWWAIAVGTFVANVRAAAVYKFTQEPESIIAEVGTFAAFSAKVSQPSTFQWHLNGVIIPGATNHDLAITPEASKVGAYVVHAYAGTNHIYSTNAFLAVYELHHTNSTFGTLTISAQQFTGAPNYFCPSYPLFIFNKYYIPVSSGNWCYFYGPYVPVSAQLPPFINSGYNKYLDVTTGANNPASTGVRLYESFDPPTNVECGCEAGKTNNLPDLEYYSMSWNTSDKLARYRATIYYIDGTLGTGNLILNWTYFN